VTAGLILVLLLAAAAAVYLVRPLLQRDALDPEEVGRASTDALRDLHSRQQMLLASLKDLEDDLATDKLDQEDYESLKQQLSAQAIEVMQQIDGLEAEQDRELKAEQEASQPLRYPGLDRGNADP